MAADNVKTALYFRFIAGKKATFLLLIWFDYIETILKKHCFKKYLSQALIVLNFSLLAKPQYLQY